MAKIEKLSELYTGGLNYNTYVLTGDGDIKKQHLYYLSKMALTKPEIESVKTLSPRTLLIFCQTECNDCRITLALLENIKRLHPGIEFRIVSRVSHEDLMLDISGEVRIPHIVDVVKRNKVIFSEFSRKLKRKNG